MALLREWTARCRNLTSATARRARLVMKIADSPTPPQSPSGVHDSRFTRSIIICIGPPATVPAATLPSRLVGRIEYPSNGHGKQSPDCQFCRTGNAQESIPSSLGQMLRIIILPSLVLIGPACAETDCQPRNGQYHVFFPKNNPRHPASSVRTSIRATEISLT